MVWGESRYIVQMHCDSDNKVLQEGTSVRDAGDGKQVDNNVRSKAKARSDGYPVRWRA